MTTSSPPATSADPKLIRLYQVIGYYITRWSLIKELLCIIYFRASILPEAVCAEEFFAVDSYQMRTKFTIFAVRAKFRKDRAKRDHWEQRIKNLNNFFVFRNFIAHNPVHEPQLNLNFVLGRSLIAHDYVVHPTFYQGKKKNLGYTYKDIAHKAKQLDAAIQQLRKDIASDFPEIP